MKRAISKSAFVLGDTSDVNDNDADSVTSEEELSKSPETPADVPSLKRKSSEQGLAGKRSKYGLLVYIKRNGEHLVLSDTIGWRARRSVRRAWRRSGLR